MRKTISRSFIVLYLLLFIFSEIAYAYDNVSVSDALDDFKKLNNKTYSQVIEVEEDGNKRREEVIIHLDHTSWKNQDAGFYTAAEDRKPVGVSEYVNWVRVDVRGLDFTWQQFIQNETSKFGVSPRMFTLNGFEALEYIPYDKDKRDNVSEEYYSRSTAKEKVWYIHLKQYDTKNYLVFVAIESRSSAGTMAMGANVQGAESSHNEAISIKDPKMDVFFKTISIEVKGEEESIGSTSNGDSKNSEGAEDKDGAEITGIKGTAKVPGPKTLAEALIGIIAAPIIGVILEIMKNLFGGTPPQPESEIITKVGKTDGRVYKLKYDPKTGYHEDLDTGDLIDIDRIDGFQDDLAEDRRRAREDIEKMEKGDTTFQKDSILKNELLKENARKLERLQYIRKEILTGRGSKLIKEPGDVGDMVRKINELEKDLSEKGSIDEKTFEAIKKAYGSHIKGDSIVEKDLPSGDSLSKEIKAGLENTLDEIARGESIKSLALKTLLGIATGGTSEIALESAKALTVMKDYVDKGGDSVVGGFTEATKSLLVDEVIGLGVSKTIEKTAKGVKSVGGSILKSNKELKKAVDEIKNQVETQMQKLTKEISLNKKLATKQINIEGERAAEEAKELIAKHRGKITKDPDLLKRDEIYYKGSKEGYEKIQKLENARKSLEKNPSSEALRKQFKKATLEVQESVSAKNQLNNLPKGTGDDLRKTFNKEMEKTYEEAMEATRERISKEYGIPKDKVKIVKATNNLQGEDTIDSRGFAKKTVQGKETDIFTRTEKTSTGVSESNVRGDKISYDKDVTVRIEQEVRDPRTGKLTKGYVDVPAKDLKRVYNDEFYKAANNGEVPLKQTAIKGTYEVDYDEIDNYAKKMDQTTTDRLSADAYGTGDQDLKTALKDKYGNKAFTDVEAVGKTMEFKANEWDELGDDFYGKALQAEKKGNFREAYELKIKGEDCKTESIRQTVKQFNNQVLKRVEVANSLKPGSAKVPKKLFEAMKVMEQVGKPGGISSAEADVILKEMGLTTQTVAEQSSSIMEGLQKLSPNTFTK